MNTLTRITNSPPNLPLFRFSPPGSPRLRSLASPATPCVEPCHHLLLWVFPRQWTLAAPGSSLTWQWGVGFLPGRGCWGLGSSGCLLKEWWDMYSSHGDARGGPLPLPPVARKEKWQFIFQTYSRGSSCKGGRAAQLLMVKETSVLPAGRQ